MSSTFFDTQGNKFLIECVLDSEHDSYASLFTTAVTYRARHVSADVDDTLSLQPQQTGGSISTAIKANHLVADTVTVTYIPLSSSVQGIAASEESAAFLALRDHVRLRRQVEHPFLRSLLDVFYTQQRLAPPVRSAPAAAEVRRPVETNSPTAARARKPERHTVDRGKVDGGFAASGGDAADRGDAESFPSVTTSPSSSSSSTDAFAALVLVEEFVEGCTLADYADAVVHKRLRPTSAKLQRDAAAIAYQLAQLLHYLHETGHIQCRELPLGNVALDQNKGFVSVRLPLSAVRVLQEPGEKRLSDVVAALVSETSQLNRESGRCWTEKPRLLRAPELRGAAFWDAMWSPASDETALFRMADVWALGLVTTLLCTLNHKLFAQTTRAERLSVVGAQIQHLPELLPHDMQEDMLHLICSCLENAPERRPTAAGVLKSAVFVKNRSYTKLEQHRAVISIAEAVANANKRKMPPVALQLAESSATAAARTAAASADSELLLLSLQETAWDFTPMCRDVFSPAGVTAAGPGKVVIPYSEQVAASLKQATQDASQDLERLCVQCARLYQVDPSGAAACTASRIKDDSLRERLRRSGQMPRDLPATIHIFEELTERFAQLERSSPDASLRFIELLLEGFTSSPQDVEAVRESVTLADALLRISQTSPSAVVEGGRGTAEKTDTFDGSTLSNSSAVDQRDFQVADVLRSMPSMPERVIASDRAANTSAVLYNQWLKKERKRFVKSDGYY